MTTAQANGVRPSRAGLRKQNTTVIVGAGPGGGELAFLLGGTAAHPAPPPLVTAGTADRPELRAVAAAKRDDQLLRALRPPPRPAGKFRAGGAADLPRGRP